jgi:hypothetical protein
MLTWTSISNGVLALILLPIPFAPAQTNEVNFQVRLSPVPREIGMAATVAGEGYAKAVLVGSTLTIAGSFKGLRSPATIARLHRGAVTGVKGTASRDLTIAKSVDGMISGSFEMTPAEILGLKAGQFYIQLHSEKAPDGNLWGWLLQ